MYLHSITNTLVYPNIHILLLLLPPPPPLYYYCPIPEFLNIMRPTTHFTIIINLLLCFNIVIKLNSLFIIYLY